VVLTESSPAVAPTLVCKVCLSPYVEGQYEFPLCWDCRKTASLRHFPRPVKVLCALVFIMVCYQYIQVFRAVSAYQEGSDAAEASDFVEAVQDFESVLELYSD